MPSIDFRNTSRSDCCAADSVVAIVVNEKGAQRAIATGGDGDPRRRLQQRGEDERELLLVEVPREVAVVGQGNGARLLGDDDADGVGVFGHADGGAMAGAQLRVEVARIGQRQQAAGGEDAVAVRRRRLA